MDRTNETATGYTYGGQQYTKQTRTDSQGNTYTVDVPTAISTAQLSQAQPLQLPSQPATPNYSGVISNAVGQVGQSNLAAQAQVDAKAQLEAQNQGSALSNLMAQTQGQIGNKASDVQSLYQSSGVNDLASQLRKLNAQAQGLQLEAQAIPLQEQNLATGQNITTAAVQRNSTDRLRENAIKALSIAQQSAVAQADYATAKDLADQQISIKYDALENDLKVKQLQLQALDKFVLTPAQEKAKESRAAALQAEEQNIAERKASEKQVNDLLIQASTVAPANILSKAREAQAKGASATEIAGILGEYAEDYWGTKLKIAQINKTYADIAETKAKIVAAGGVGSDKTVDTQTQAKFLLDTIAEASNLSSASGRSAARRGTEAFLVGATDYTNLESKVRTLKTNLLTLATDPNVKKFFGPQMTEADVRNMQAAATTLDTESQTPAELKAELERAQKIFGKFVPGYKAPVEAKQTASSWAESVTGALLSPTQGGNYGYQDNKQ